MLVVVAGFQAVQRATNFGIANVARESLWTVVSRDEKFKAKNIVDGSVFRGADAVNGWLSKLLAVADVCAGAGAGVRAALRPAGSCCRWRWAGSRKSAPAPQATRRRWGSPANERP